MPTFGWKKDLDVHIAETDVAGPAYRADRYGAPRIALPSACYDLMRFCKVRDQKGSSACVGFAITGAVYCRLHYLGYDCDLFSPIATYNIGRQLEGIYKGKALPDDGSYPFLVMNGCRKFGLVTEKELPFDSHWEERVTKEVPFDIFQKASQFRLHSFSRIAVSGDARIDTVMRAIAAGHPVPLGMEVGTVFQNYANGRDPVGREFNSLGGHMTFLCGYENNGEVFIGCNSWGKDWGDGGFYRITRDKLTDPTTTDLYDFVITDLRA